MVDTDVSRRARRQGGKPTVKFCHPRVEGRELVMEARKGSGTVGGEEQRADDQIRVLPERAASEHRNRRPFAPSYGRLTDVLCGALRSPRLPPPRCRLRLAERRRWRGPTPRDARSSG